MDMFGRGFKSGKCKTLLRLAMSRIKLLRNKREIQLKVMKREIANLLQSGQEPSARIRVEHIFREQNVLAAYEIVELFCELVVVRLPIIESQKQCPLDLKEAIASLIFAAPRCSDLPELLEARGLFAAKYGKEFVAAASELRPDCGVNRRIIEKLSVRAPSGEVKLKLLRDIAAEHNVDWDPADSEAELLKQHEDLLDGPSQFMQSSQRPLATQSQRAPIVMEPLLVEEDDLPSVPVQNPVTSAPAEQPSRPADVRPSSPPQSQLPKPFVRPASPPPSHKDLGTSDDVKQFVPFLSPHPSRKFDATPTQPAPQKPQAQEAAFSTTPSMEYRDVAAAAQAAAESAERAATAARAAASLAKANVVPTPAGDSSDSETEMEVPANVRPTNFSRAGSQHGGKSFRKVESSSESEDDDDNEQFSRGSKPEPQPSEPQFDTKYDQEDDQDALWKRPFWRQEQPESRFSFSPPRAPKPAWSTRYDDNFGTNAEDRLNSQSSTESSLFKQDVEDVFQHQGSGKQQGISPTSSLPRFDEPEPEDVTPFPKAPSVFQESRSFKTQQGPPQRRPPDVPRPPVPEAPSPKATLSPSDSGGSGSFAVHPKLPDYEELAARFQALKTSKR